jgi:hypothetical protein
MFTCGTCPYWDILVPSMEGYDPKLVLGRCLLCPPVPTGEYKGDYSQWPIVLATNYCNLCRCRGCSGQRPPITYFIKQENDDYLLQENSDKLEQEY